MEQATNERQTILMEKIQKFTALNKMYRYICVTMYMCLFMSMIIWNLY